MLFSGNGRNRGPAKAARLAVLGGVASAAVALPMVTAPGAQAASTGTWEKVAECESSGNWQADTGNGHYGGLQFSDSSWKAAGGTKYAPRADQATKEQQIATAEKLLDRQGPGAWACAGQAGLSADDGATPAGGSSPGGASDDDSSSGGSSSGGTSSGGGSHSSGKGGYTVKPGDTLGSIAESHGVGLKKVYENNKSVIGGDVDVIHPGQKLQIG
ncbi:LysM peptidoglycan-binding domain-containing protein [Streptomyces sp. HNM0575]|uniref:LysM peptidoglycan-binding domain-containing protein n=1 Tax=Streptomyces sp. HNM0575 TaxID=2716338 RepID=UPI00145CCB34|nr:transglycosylase family protein [Streptomyces sp. HNM0575]NLU71339.1 LysM peptidoglycan-binding domain-containing protein [Streptomyces sp. HNM0575]